MIKKKKDIFYYILILGFTFFIFSKYLTGHFAVDTFYITDKGYKGYAINHSFLDGRLFMGIIGLIVDRFNISIEIYNIIILITTVNYLPIGIFLSFLIVIIIETLYKVINEFVKQKEEILGKKILFEQYFLIFSCICFSFIPSIISLTAFFSGRLRTSLGALIGILFIHILVKTNFSKNKKIIDNILIGTLCIYAIINSVNYIYFIELNKTVNKLDIDYAKTINEYISDYEIENNIKVKYIAVIPVYGESKKAFYKEMNCYDIGIAVSALRTEWGSRSCINYYTGRNLIDLKVSKEEEENYLKLVGPNDYLCIENTLFITTYWN